MRSSFSTLVAVLILLGCSKPEMGTLSQDQSPNKQKQGTSTGGYLAYEHTVSLDLDEAKLKPTFELLKLSCEKSVNDPCELLSSDVDTGRFASANLKIRTTETGVRSLILMLNQQGTILSQSTKAEDLASPIKDGEKQLAMLNDYRKKLELLSERASKDITALITVNKELAQVQSEIEAMNGKNAYLMKRVQTQLLSVHLHTRQSRSMLKPISEASHDFGDNLAQGFSSVITASAYLLPWSLLLGFVTWLVRKLWLRRRPRI